MGAEERKVAGRRSVALIPSSYHPYFGGVEEHTRHVATGLIARGMDVEIWTPDRGEGLGEVEREGVRVRYLPTPMPARKFSSLAAFARHALVATAAWIQAFRQFRPEILHVQCFGPNGTYALGLATIGGRPLVITSHGETFADDNGVFERSALQRWALKKALSRAKAVTACSAMVGRDLMDRFGAPEVRVVPNGVDLDPSPARRSRSESRQTVVAAGRMVENKGFDLLIRAAATLPSQVRLRLIGDGPERQNLERLAAALEVKNVDFLGRKGAAQVQELMAQADVVVVPSRVEAFGIVVLEAWASGTPLVVTTRGGPADLVTDGVDGRVVDPVDTEALGSVIEEVLADPAASSRMAKRGLDTVKHYTWTRVVDDYLQIYDAVLAPQFRSSGPPQSGYDYPS